jgi:hypothetical protein
MKKIPLNDIIIGMNDSLAVLHMANDKRNDQNFSTYDLYESTKNKRRWSIINPGLVMAQSYMYFVVGHESGFLDDFPSSDKTIKFINQFSFHNDEYQIKKGENKIEAIKRHLRNSISHSRYNFFINTPSGEIHKDGDLIIVFEDYYPKNNGKEHYCKFQISFPDFANLIESTGEMTFNKTTPQHRV